MKKAAEGSRSPKPGGSSRCSPSSRSVLECGCPLPLSASPYNTGLHEFMTRIKTPVSETDIRRLKVGDEVAISGIVFTGRDAVHKYLHEGGQLPPGVNLKDGILYHCGPVVVKD